jgi:chorismate--pyruvate lyase
VQRWPRRSLPDPFLVRWLLDPHSLTDRVRSCCRDGFSVRVASQGWGAPEPNEAQILGVRLRSRVLLREVQLLCGKTPWVFARTLIPVHTLTGARRRLGYLGNKPLGAFLFADPAMRRGPVELACIRPATRIYRAATEGLVDKPDELWGRRSVFRLAGKPLLVCEIFLPSIAPCDTRLTTIGPR